jgi:hypothetical protein
MQVLEEDDKQSLTVDQQKYSMRNVVERLNKARFETCCFYSCQRDEVYIKVRASPQILLFCAAGEDYKLKLDENRLKIR